MGILGSTGLARVGLGVKFLQLILEEIRYPKMRSE